MTVEGVAGNRKTD